MSHPKLLIAHPSIIGDATFHRAVIILHESADENPLGFIINKPLDLSLSDLLPEVKTDIPVHYGGPVEEDHLFFLYQGTTNRFGGKAIAEHLFLGGNVDDALEQIAKKEIEADSCRFFMGYSGWETEQLAMELEQDTWLVQYSTSLSKLLKTPPEEMWRSALVAQGGSYPLWANTPENPSWN